MKTYLALAILLSCLFFSCKKQNIVCTGNCYSLNVDGKVVNSLTNTVVADVPLIINQWRYTVSRRTVDELSSNSAGIFNKDIRIDSTMFQNGYFLSLTVKENDNYMTLRDKGNIRLYDLNSNTFSNSTITVYPKANLSIKLNRNQNDDFEYFQIVYYFVEHEEFFAFSILSPKDLDKKELIVPTSSDIFTKVRATKRNSNGVYTTTLDSIKCIKGGTNIYTVNF